MRKSKETAQASANQLVYRQSRGCGGPVYQRHGGGDRADYRASRHFQISPTITAMEFLGKDDNLYRINRTTRDNAGTMLR